MTPDRPVLYNIKSIPARSLKLCFFCLLALVGAFFSPQHANAQIAIDLDALGYSPDQIDEMSVLSKGRLRIPCVTLYKDGVQKRQFRTGIFSAVTTRFPILLRLESLIPSTTSCLTQINSYDFSSLTFSGTIQHQMVVDEEFVVIDLYELVLSQNPLTPLIFELTGPDNLYRVTPPELGPLSLTLLPGQPVIFQPDHFSNTDEYDLTDIAGDELSGDFNLLVLDAGIEITAEESAAPLFSGDTLLTGLFKLINHSKRIVHPLSLSLIIEEEEEEPAETPPPNLSPTITSGSSYTLAENLTLVTDIQSSDPNGETEGVGLGYSLSGGSDQAMFNINVATGVLTFAAAPDFEAPSDADINNIYLVSVTVTDAGGLSNTSNLSITVSDANDPPSITSATAINVAENQTAVIDASATDIEGDTEGAGLTWSLTGGADQALFSIDANTGVLAFVAAHDFEGPNDAGKNNVYDVDIAVTDSGGQSVTQAIAATVTDVNEVPVITSSATVTVVEQQTAVSDIQASDSDGDTEGAGLGYSLSGGTDQGLFTIDTSTGVLAFVAAPDFDAPGDSDTNNLYTVEVTVTDSDTLSVSRTLSVTVTNVNEAPLITSSATLTVNENLVAVVDVQSTDPDGETEGAGLSYSLSGGTDQALFSIDANTGALAFITAPDFEAPGDVDINNIHAVAVTVTDAGGLMNAQTLSITVQNVNEAPVLTTTAGAYSNFEDAMGVIYFNAEDPEGDDFTFAMSGSETGTLYYPKNLAHVANRVSSLTFDLSGTTDWIAELFTTIGISNTSFTEFIGTSATFNNGFVFAWQNDPDSIDNAEFNLVLRDVLDAQSAESTYTLTTRAVNDAPLINHAATGDITGDLNTPLQFGVGYITDSFVSTPVSSTFETGSTESLGLSFTEVEVEDVGGFDALYVLTVTTTLPTVDCPVSYRDASNNIVTLEASPLDAKIASYAQHQQYISTLTVNCATPETGSVTITISDSGFSGDCFAPHPNPALGEVGLDGNRCVRVSEANLNLTFVDP